MEFATVKAGHDKGQIYYILRDDAECVYLVNGTTKPMEKPKKKNKKHIQLIKKVPQDVLQIMKEKLPENQKIKKAIKTLKLSYK